MASTASEDRIIQNTISRYDLHQLHVVNQTQPVNADYWAEMAGGWEIITTWFVYHNRDGHHLRLYW